MVFAWSAEQSEKFSLSDGGKFEENPDYRTEIFREYSRAGCASYARIYRVDLDAPVTRSTPQFRNSECRPLRSLTRLTFVVILFGNSPKESECFSCYRRSVAIFNYFHEEFITVRAEIQSSNANFKLFYRGDIDIIQM